MSSPLKIAVVSVALLLVPSSAAAFPGFFVGKTEAQRHTLQSQVVVMKKDGRTAVTVLADYAGPLDDFAVVLPVPGDVVVDRVRTLRRDFLDRIDQITAPRFHEFWEKDPCAPGKAQQIWEISLKASAQTAFLGGGSTVGKEKVPKELLLKVEPEFKETSGEYEFSVVPKGEDVAAWLEHEGYRVTEPMKKAVARYRDDAFLIAAVDSQKLELVAGGRAQLSPIRYWTETPVTRIAARLGRLSAKGMQELVVYVLDPKHRFEVENYGNVYPPTNLEVDFKVKERMGEFYAGLHDALLRQNPKRFLVEWIGPTSSCGQPCATPALQIYEILSLGADAFEEFVPDEQKHPEVPDLTEEEKKKVEAKIDSKLEEMEGKTAPQKKKLKKELLEQEEERRIELARRKALIARNAYVVTRLHHRYDDETLPEDVVLTPAAGHRAGGFDLPQGEAREMGREVKDADADAVQLRYVHFHPWKGMQKCEKPERWRWGKPPRTYRGRRKIWEARELGTMDRKEFDLAKVVLTPVPSLGLKGAVTPASDAGGGDAAASSGESADGKSCGCRVPGSRRPPHGVGWLSVLALALGARRRRL